MSTEINSLKPLKIGIVLDGGLSKPDGVQQYVLNLAKYLRNLNYEVRFIVAGKVAPGIEGADILTSSINVRSNGNVLSIPIPAKNRQIKNYLSQNNFDVIHVQVPYSPFLGGKIIKYCQKKTVVIGTFHVLPKNRLLFLANRLLGVWLYFNLKRFDKMLSVSNVASDFCLRTFKIKSEVVPNMVDYKRFNQASSLTEYTDNKLNVLYLGRLVKRKDCLTLLKAVDYLINSNRFSLPDFRLIIAGSGHLLNKLNKYVQKHNLSKVVEFKGFVSEDIKANLYASSDIAVFPSYAGESFGIVLLEAMSSGRTAVLAADNPGYSSVLSENKQLIFKARDYKALADKLYIYLSDHVLRQRTAEWCSSYAANYDVNKVASRINNIYNQLLHNKDRQ